MTRPGDDATIERKKEREERGKKKKRGKAERPRESAASTVSEQHDLSRISVE
ncbi:hypothetical protein X777_02932 [Ooceraea biroi]|uniref:Uncharacterized protein n=1 Tax=Ooceraea biroi TaxID=2015173 RepID=A0A026WK17_OOCBI|nr:hypothetical protein X777_02932 [Ooceraea biroi]